MIFLRCYQAIAELILFSALSCILFLKQKLAKEKEIELVHLSRSKENTQNLYSKKFSLTQKLYCYFLLQLKMVVAKGSVTENVLMELSIPQFFEFMHEMEKANLELESKF